MDLKFKALSFFLVVAGLSGTAWLHFGNLFQSSHRADYLTGVCSLLLIALGLLLFVKLPASFRLILPCLIVLVSLVPHVSRLVSEMQKRSASQKASLELHQTFNVKRRQQEDEIEQRIIGKRPFTPEESVRFVVSLIGWNLSWHGGLPNYMAEAEKLLEKAIKGGVLDPNATLKSGETVAVGFYRPLEEISLASYTNIPEAELGLYQVMLKNGAIGPEPVRRFPEPEGIGKSGE